MPASLLDETIDTRGMRTTVHYEADSQAFRASRDFVYLDSSTDKVTAITTTGTLAITSGYANKVAGLAMQKGRNTTGDDIANRDCPVQLFQSDDSWVLLPLWASTSGTSEYRDAKIGLNCCLRYQNGIWVASITETSNPTLVLMQKQPGIAVAEPYARAWFRTISTIRHSG